MSERYKLAQQLLKLGIYVNPRDKGTSTDFLRQKIAALPKEIIHPARPKRAAVPRSSTNKNNMVADIFPTSMVNIVSSPYKS